MFIVFRYFNLTCLMYVGYKCKLLVKRQLPSFVCSLDRIAFYFSFKSGSKPTPRIRVKWTPTVFSEENRNPFWLAHLLILFILPRICLSHIDMLHEKKEIWIASTNKEEETPGGMTLPIEFILMAKSATVKILPCGTSFSRKNDFDSAIPIRTRSPVN